MAGNGKINKAQLSASLVDEIFNSGGSGGSANVTIRKFTQKITSSVNKISIGTTYFDKDTDTLFVFKNSVYLEVGIDYIINDDHTISKVGGGNWDGSTIEPLVFNFVCLMNIPDTEKLLPGSKIVDATITEAKLDSTVKVKLNKSTEVTSLDGSKLVDNTVSETKLDASVKAKLNKSTEVTSLNGSKLVDNTVSEVKLDASVKAKLNKSTEVTSLNGSKLIDATVSEVKLDTALREKINKSSGGSDATANTVKRRITKEQWTADGSTFSYTLQHSLFSDITSIMMYSTTGAQIEFSYTIINNDTVKLNVITPEIVDVVILGLVAASSMTAPSIGILDIENNFTSNNVEGALKELANLTDTGQVSILQYCTVDSKGEIHNQDAKIQEWINSGKSLILPVNIEAYISSPKDVSYNTHIFGGGTFCVEDNFSGEYVIGLEHDCFLDKIRVVNKKKRDITLVKIKENAHDCVIADCNLIANVGCTQLVIYKSYFTKVYNTTIIFLEGLNDGVYNKCVGIEATDCCQLNLVENDIRCTLLHNNNTFNAIEFTGTHGVSYSNLFINNTFYAFNIKDGICIRLHGNPRQTTIKGNTVQCTDSTQEFGFVNLNGNNNSIPVEIYNVSICDNIASLYNGWFLYGGKNVNILQSLVSNNITTTETGIDVYGFHSLFSGNSVRGRWFGQDGNQVVAMNNINANIQGSWNSNSTGNITTI